MVCSRCDEDGNPCDECKMKEEIGYDLPVTICPLDKNLEGEKEE